MKQITLCICICIHQCWFSICGKLESNLKSDWAYGLGVTLINQRHTEWCLHTFLMKDFTLLCEVKHARTLAQTHLRGRDSLHPIHYGTVLKACRCIVVVETHTMVM